MAEVGSAFVSLVPSAKGFGRATEKQIGGQVDSAGKNTGKRFGTAMKGGALAVVGGALIAGKFLAGAIGEAREAQKVGALTNAVIKSTGGVANVTAKDVDKLSTALSNKIGVDDEAIAAGQNMLLTFSNVRNEVGKGNQIFNRATVAASDMAAAFGGDAVSNSKMLGKALNDPVKGVSALTRVGVSFTQGQKDQIKALQETGDTLGAQKIILGEVTKQTQGAAESQASAADKVAVGWGNVKEQIGTVLLPVLDKFLNVVSGKIIPAVSNFIAGIQDGTGAGAGFVAKAKEIGGYLLSTLGPVVMRLGAWIRDDLVPPLRDLAADLLPKVRTLFGAVKTALSDAQPFFTLVGNIITKVLIPAIGEIAKRVIPIFVQQLQNMGRFLGAVGRAGKSMWNNVLQPVFKFMATALGKIMTSWGKLLQTMGDVPGFGWVGKLGDKLVNAGEDASGLATKIKDIPDKKEVKITADTRAATASLNSWLAAANNHAVRVPVYRSGATPGGTAGRRALGGPVGADKTYLVGERGPELFTSRTAGRITPNHDLTGNSSGPTTLNLYDVNGVLMGSMQAAARKEIGADRGMVGQRTRARAIA